jgi:hypothetical protein
MSPATARESATNANDVVPLRRQYLQIKARYPDTILFFRLGDFYETFDGDAETASRVLDIVLTGREMGKNLRVPMAGIPYHAADGYIARLISAGHRVAVCEQVGEVAKAAPKGTAGGSPSCRPGSTSTAARTSGDSPARRPTRRPIAPREPWRSSRSWGADGTLDADGGGYAAPGASGGLVADGSGSSSTQDHGTVITVRGVSSSMET